MATGVLQHRGGPTADRLLVTPQDREFFVDTDTYEVYVGDGSTAGGILVGSIISGITIVSKTSNYTLLTGDSGKQFNNTGAGGAVELSLPSATIGLNYAACITAAQYLKLTAFAGEFIYWGEDASAAGGYIRHNGLGSFISIICHDTGKWMVSSITGNWSIDA